jgi:hypothetical protein
LRFAPVPTTRSREDFHLLTIAHAGHTTEQPVAGSNRLQPATTPVAHSNRTGSPQQLERTNTGEVTDGGAQQHPGGTANPAAGSSSSNGKHPASPEAGAVVAFCKMTGAAWTLKQPLAEWAISLKADYPGIQVAYEVKKAAEYHQAKQTNVRSPSQTISNWLDRAKPGQSGTTGQGNAMRITPAELRARYG